MENRCTLSLKKASLGGSESDEHALWPSAGRDIPVKSNWKARAGQVDTGEIVTTI